MILFPDNWMQAAVPHIKEGDFVLVGSMTQLNRLEEGVDWNKVILYNWDHYSFIDYPNRPDWIRFHAACRKAREVWCPTHAHASYFKRDTGINSKVLNMAYVLPNEWGDTRDGGYALMSSRKDWYKRFAMFEQACRTIDIPYKVTHPEETSREEYIKFMSGCRFYVQASVDESLGGLSLMEAVWNRKPVLMSDSIAGGREVYGDSINYFSAYDYRDFIRQLRQMMGPIHQPNARTKIETQTPEGVAEMINRRLCELRST